MDKTQKEIIKWFKEDRKDIAKELKDRIHQRDYERCIDLGARLDYIDYALGELEVGGSLNKILSK